MSILNKGPSQILRKVNDAKPPTSKDETKPDELDEVLAGFRERDREMRARFSDINDTECWVAICFNTRADKDAFVEAFGLADYPLVTGTVGNKYVDGYALADAWLKAADEPDKLPEE